MKRFLKPVIFTSILLTVLSVTFLFTPLTASAKSYSSGGGCSETTYYGNSTRFVEYSSCITSSSGQHFWDPDEVTSDAYVTFGAGNDSYWVTCMVWISTIDTNGNNIGNDGISCLQQARSHATNAHFSLGQNPNTISGHSYYTLVFVDFQYNTDCCISYGPGVYSPHQYIS